MDKSWVHKDRWTNDYQDGVRLFLDYAFKNGFVTEDNKMRCPCRDCNNICYHTEKKMFEDLVLHGMMRSYTTWFHHGESSSSTVLSSTRPDIDAKTKDGLKARFDLQLLNIRPELHPIMIANGSKYFLPNACYFMDNAKKEMFL
ncbi:hypothetical protein MKW92_019112, partial [Papaver armeniacum]